MKHFLFKTVSAFKMPKGRVGGRAVTQTPTVACLVCEEIIWM